MQLINKKLKLLSFFLIGLFFITNVYAKKFPDGYPECWQDPENPVNLNLIPLDVNKNNLGQDPNIFCPINSKLGHKFFLIDFTSPLAKAQIDWIDGRVFADSLVKTTPPYHKISYMKIDDTAPQSQVIAYSQCRMKTGNKSKFVGEETNSGCEGSKQINTAFQAWLMLNETFQKKFLSNYKQEANRSLIFEYLFHVLREQKTDFTSEYPVRELVIVSDLMQHSKRFSFYSHCKTDLSSVPNKCRSFKSLLKKSKVKNYIDDRKPKKELLKNLKITILYINHDYETRDGLSSSLVALWEDLFKHIGIENYEIVKQLDID